MIIEQGNIKLIKLTEEYIELVRQKRNDPEIRMTMEYREHITSEMQQKWFTSINNIYNNYFLIHTCNAFIGLISATDIDWEHKITNNGGIFIWDKKYHESTEAMGASILLTDLGFFFGMEKNYVRILRDNKKSIAYNQSIGYKLLSGQEEIYNQKYVLTSDAYFKATEKIRRFFNFTDHIIFRLDSTEQPFYKKMLETLSLRSGQYLKTTSIEIIVS